MAGIVLVMGPPRLTLLNAGLRIDYAGRQGFGGLLAFAGLGLLASVAGRAWARTALAIVAAAALLVALDFWRYRLEIDDAGLTAWGWLGRTAVPWREVSRVEAGPAVLVVWGSGDAQIRVDTSAFRPEQRAALERAIARRVGESGSRLARPER